MSTPIAEVPGSVGSEDVGTAADAAPAATRAGLRASQGDGTYPRPQLVRPAWTDLCGTWDFAADPDDVGRDARWFDATGDGDPFDRRIEVPFPPESSASGIGGPHHHVVWYRRSLDAAELERAGLRSQGDRLVLHLGAVDHAADVWLGGVHLGRHVGGQTPFSFDVTSVVATGRSSLALVVRAEDDPLDVSQPRGKQDWRNEPHSIWYHRTTGIWQPVWLEAVPRLHVAELAWRTDVPAGVLHATVRLSERPRGPVVLSVRVAHEDEVLAEQWVRTVEQDVRVTVDLPTQHNGQRYEELLWSPERPTLLDAWVAVAPEPASSVPDQARHKGAPVRDVVASYVGLRSVAVEHGRFLLNDRPYYLRSVLEQGYWEESHLAAPSAAALRREVELIKELGFNSARVHQKAEDPRFLFWADRLGLTLWGETANAYAFSPRSVQLLATEWAELVRRDMSHPSIVTWVPLNESWGVQHVAHDAAQRHYSLGLAALTRALDPTRPVVSNDGWEHTDSDIWSIHDYSERGEELRARYGTPEAVRALLDGIGPAGRRIRLVDVPDRGQPLMITEFGGVSYAGGRDDAWGYSTATSDEDFAARIGDLLDAVRACPPVAGYCWTQLTDTGQETNGLLRADRTPKLPIDTLRRLVTGTD